jgi:hypothetical protein
MIYRYGMRLAPLFVLLPLAACGPDSPSGACKDSLLPGDLVITEVFADYAAPTGGTGTDEGKEWFEIYNNSDRAVSLKGVTVVHARPDGSKPNSHTMTDVTVGPGQFFTLGNATSDLVPPYIDYGYSADLGDFFNSDGGKLTLKCGDDELDSAIYDSVKSGHSRQFSNAGPPDYTLNDDQANWCEAKDTEFEPKNFGTPGEDNDCAPVVAGACTDGNGMRPVVTPAVGDIVITEVMPGPSKVSDTLGEWFEIKALNDVDLNGIGIDRAGDSSAPNVLSSNACLHVAAGDYAVFAKNTDSDMNGGVAPVLGTFSLSLVAGTTTAPGDIQLVAGTTVLDSITWTSSRSGKALQLDPEATDPSANDEPSNFCDATVAYGLGDLGTPNAENSQCAAVAPTGMCLENNALRPIKKPAANAVVINEYLANPAGTMTGVDAAQEWFEISNAGTEAFDLNELSVQGAGATTSKITASDCKSVAPGGFALLAHNTDPAINGGLPAVDATFPTSIALGNSAGRIQILDGMTVLDTIAWTAASGGPDGISLQLNPANRDAAMNDAPPLNYCQATATYGTAGNKGTPKAANVCP